MGKKKLEELHYGDLDQTTKTKENKARYHLKNNGYKLVRQPRAGYMIIDAGSKAVVAGASPAFGLTLDDVEVFAYTRRP